MSTPLAVLDAAAVRAWFEHALRSLLLVRRQVDRLNLFPVPDADTGTNLVLTLSGAAEAVGELDPAADLATLTRAAADGALLGARGNSGVIVGQCLQALAETFAGADEASPALLARALTAADAQARAAMVHPVEGTILTVARAAAGAARAAADDGDLAATVAAASRAARDALAATGGAHGAALDAGAAGYVVLLGALVDIVAGEGDTGTHRADAVGALLAGLGAAAPDAAAADPPARGRTSPDAAGGGSGTAVGTPLADAAVDTDDAAGDFEVMYLLRADAARAAALRATLARTGHSVAVVGAADATGAGVWQVHVHTDAPLTALAEPAVMDQVCVRYLRPLLTGLARPEHGHAPENPAAPAGSASPETPATAADPAAPEVTAASAAITGVVACTRAPGLLEPLARTGAVVVLDPPADPAGLLRAAADTGAPHVLVLPCDEAAATTARAAARAAEGRGAPHLGGRQEMTVAATRNELHVLAAAVEVSGPGAPAAGALLPALAEQAARRVRTVALDADAAVARLAGELGPADELVTALLGAGADDEVAEQLRETVARVAPQVEVVVVRGGQSAPAVLVGVE
ncbi:DAK2 domain-containing protein [Georgenia ruanii]|uniref:DAK2 domain-containing protein n=1 Tax=Georgenia ruanii TaxID=348442 RepID=UPI001264B8C1|nr:DAK2 domain-containing protein [Georgenia ruanii]